MLALGVRQLGVGAPPQPAPHHEVAAVRRDRISHEFDAKRYAGSLSRGWLPELDLVALGVLDAA